MAPSPPVAIPSLLPSPPSIAHFFASNDPPNAVESSTITAHIEELKSQLALLEETMHLFSLHREELELSIRAHQAILSPVRRLPPETLGEIFSFAAEAAFKFGDISEVLEPATFAPWLLMRISRQWSAVARMTPEVWSRILLPLDNYEGKPGRAESIAKICVERSKTVPLRIRVLHGGGDFELKSRLAVDALLTSSERWTTADIYVSSPMLTHFASLHGRTPMLDTLLIAAEVTQPQNEAYLALSETFAHAVALRSLSAQFWGEEGYCLPPFSFPWHQLKRLIITFASNLEALAVLQQLTNIVECQLEYNHSHPLPVNTGSVCLPFLRLLRLQVEEDELQSDGPTTHPSLLDFFETPRLESLDTSRASNARGVLELLRRSKCGDTLRLLRVHTDTVVGTDFVLALIQEAPKLSELEVGDLNGNIAAGFPWLASRLLLHFRAQAQRGGSRDLQLRLVDGRFGGQVWEEIAELREYGVFTQVTPETRYWTILWAKFGEM